MSTPPRHGGERVILVGPDDEDIGTADKLEVHHTGALHRAFSVFIVSPRGELLLQRRSRDKYHSGGLWANTCCGHPRPGEPTLDAAHRRLGEEMGISCPLTTAGTITYHVAVEPRGLVEHEYDHLFVGSYDGDPTCDPAEVVAWRWAPLAELDAQLAAAPGDFAPWFGRALAHLRAAGHLPGDGRRAPRP